jgi:hypothetical protein
MKTERPSKTSRETCWKARDEYFKCLDDNGLWLEGLQPKTHSEIVEIQPSHPPTKTYEKASFTERRSMLYTCHLFKELYQKECLKSWVTHFETTRIQEKQTEYLMKKLQEDQQKANGDDFWNRVQQKDNKG